jgi:hypothetical protein
VREAFKPANPQNNVKGGLLTDVLARDNEQQGMHQLMAGAMLIFRNPSGHQNLDINPKESAELLMFASHLMGIVDKRVAALGTNNAQSVSSTVQPAAPGVSDAPA